MRHVGSDQDDVQISSSGYLLKIVFDLLMLTIVHHDIYARFQPSQQVASSLPVTNVGAEENAATPALHNLPQVILAVKLIRELVIDASHDDYLIEQSLTEDVIISVDRKDGSKHAIALEMTEIPVDVF